MYEAADFVVVRAPLLPVEAYLALGEDTATDPATLPHVHRALAVGSVRFLDALRSSGGQEDRRRVESTLLRYMIRMSTRPTPFGLFAGVGLGGWGERTDLELSTVPRPQRSRPDMGWLMGVVLDAESDPEIRRHLRLVANRGALTHSGRVFLAERASRGEVPVPPAVSIRATSVVRRALEAACEPTPYATLADLLLRSTAGATPDKVDALLTELWEQTLLLTDLRPPLTVDSPCRYVLDRLHAIPAAATVRTRLQSVLDAAAAWDASPDEAGAERYRSMVTQAAEIAPFDRSPIQVDATVALTGRTVSHAVGREAARAAELLLRMSPLPRGPSHLAGYRRLFERRYGMHREVPLLELLDPIVGLGPPPTQYALPVADAAISQAKSVQRNRALLDLAATALRERTRCVELDERTLARMQTWEPSVANAAPSLDLFVSVAAASPEALDAGDFQLVVGPNVGGMAAGRTLGRFADMLPDAEGVLQRTAAVEEALEPGTLWVELAYQPRRLRLGNVSIRPNVRRYEIAVGLSAGGDAARTIPVDELVVGVRGGRFYVHWPAAGRDVAVTVGHMLTHIRAPALCRFLSEVGRDGRCQLAGFQWGVASSLPFLPRVQAGRIVLALAQWRLATGAVPDLPVDDPDAFQEGLDRWRSHWEVPRHVYLSEGDNRLLLDLSAPAQVEELRRALSRRDGEHSVVVTEVFPDLGDAWVRDADGRHFMTELVVPLVLGEKAPEVDRPADGAGGVTANGQTSPAMRLRPLGSEWVFAKLYGGRDLEDELLAGAVRDFSRHALSSGLADEWFFIRYTDEGRHLRLRFRGRAGSLLQDFLPVLCGWVDERMQHGICRRFVLDTYDREIERFGGDEGTRAAETLFWADSQAVVDLLHLLQARTITLARLPLAVLTVDAVLDGLGLDAESRSRWCRRHVLPEHAVSGEYRQWKGLLRPLLASGARAHLGPGGAEVDDILGRLRAAGAAARATLGDLESQGRLARPVGHLYQSIVHLHLNRLLDGDKYLESRVLGLLWRVQEGLHRSGKTPA